MKHYFEIIILDSCGDVYDSLREHFDDVRVAGKRILDMRKHDKELGSEYGVWDYRIVEHEITENEDLYQIWKLYKYRGIWKVKVDTEYFI